MEAFIKNIEVRWSDLDPNFHMRHSVYYDYGASVRIDFLQENGFNLHQMQERAIGLVIFREECVFKKEITINDNISLDFQLIRATPDYSRWSIRHTVFKNRDTVAAIISLDGAWIHLVKRKLAVPPEEAARVFDMIPRAENFEWIAKNN
jgi:acyl-CoA thioester hydrolase